MLVALVERNALSGKMATPLEKSRLLDSVQDLLSISQEAAEGIIADAERLYMQRMQNRFSQLRVRERLKRTNPFLLRIRGITTVEEWAATQVRSALFASEEEAAGHLLEAIAIWCHPNARSPKHPDDFDYEVIKDSKTVHGYQVKMSWDCMPMSSRKNLSNTIRRLQKDYREQDIDFVGIFAPCYGKASTTHPPGQEYVSMSSREFWARVGGGNNDFDHQVGEVCALLCSEFRSEIEHTLIADLIKKLTKEATQIIGQEDGQVDYRKLFRAINR